MKNKVEYQKGLYDRKQAGDETARDELILSIRYLVEYHAAYIASNKHMFDELVSEGNVELVKCVDRWEFRGKQIDTYAYQCIKLAMWRYLSRHEKMFKKVDNDKILRIDDQETGLIDSIELGFSDKPELSFENKQIFDIVCKILTPHQKQIMKLLYEKDMRPFEIAKVMNIGLGSINTTLGNARKRIRNAFTKQQFGL